MLSPDQLIGQRVWLEVERDSNYPGLDPYRVKAVINQPTSPPWFYARYEDPPRQIREPGRWLTLLEAQQAFLFDPVMDEEELALSDDYDEYSGEVRFS